MGDRVSIAFRNGDELSVTLFHHWGGLDFPQIALKYARDLSAEIKARPIGSRTLPLDSLEPATVMVDFIGWLPRGQSRVMRGLYLGATPVDGDNSDNGHWIIDLETMMVEPG